MPCTRRGKEPADLLLKEVTSMVPSTVPSKHCPKCGPERGPERGPKHGPKHGPSHGLPSSPILRACSGRFRPCATKHIREPGQAPGMLETSAHTDAVPAPASINRRQYGAHGTHTAPRSPSAPHPRVQRGRRAALPTPGVRTGGAAEHVAGEDPCGAGRPAGLGDAPRFARVTVQE